MIVYDLACESSHRFEGWFTSAEEFDLQSESGKIACPVCGSISVSRQVSAPYVNTRAGMASGETRDTAVSGQIVESLRRKLVEHVMANTEDVGERFPDEARRIHYQETAARSIRGRASSDDVQELREEGIEVLALPGLPVPPDQVH